ncbi:MAG: family 43 glycosylhydrolase [Verrucomicrobia subdivision 3 bacterium]|nr:family 43 glycosylhydrolase [Limisphaerales bacterium]
MKSQSPNSKAQRNFKSRRDPLDQWRRLKFLWCLAFAIWCFHPISVPAQNTYSNPVLPGDYPDPSVIRVGDEYWATATTSEWAPLFPILKSRDLVNWEHVGNVFEKRPEWSVGNYWAPEIAEHNGTYFIYYVGRKRGGPLALAVATAPHPLGPWRDHGPLVAQDAGSIDAVPISDEKGERYLIWKEDGNSRRLPTPLWIQKLSSDGTKLVGEMKEILRNDAAWEKNLVEGPFVVQRDGMYYLFYSGSGCCGRNCDYALGVARAKNLMGPWEKNPANPILAGNQQWVCPGHGSIVQDKSGHDYLLYHAYDAKTFVYVGRQGLLDEVRWGANGWPTINQGRGPSVTAPMPVESGLPKRVLAFADEFVGRTLRPEWQWPQYNSPKAKIDDGFLTLRAEGTNAHDIVAAIVAIKTTTGDYTATTSIDTKTLTPESKAGLSAYGDRENALGVYSDGTTVAVWRRQKNKTETLASAAAPKGSRLQFRLGATAGHKFGFATSADGREWTPIGNDISVEGRHLPPWDRGVRVALTTGGSTNALARFDFLRVNPAAD